MNVLILSGNIAKIYKNSEKNVKVVIADQYKDHTEFLPVMCFDDKARWAADHLEIGDHVTVHGCVGSYDTGTGDRKLSLVAHKISFEGYPSPRRRETAAQTYKPVVQQHAAAQDPYF